MTLQQIHYVITIADQGSMNKAATLLYTAQPSLTSAVRELERELGITIFHRSGRGVTLTADGEEFLSSARRLYGSFEELSEKYSGKKLKKKFGVSTQHYSFAVKAFVELVKRFGTLEYELAIRESKTKEVISDVAGMRSEIGILYLSSFNRAAIMKLLRSSGLVFNHLTDCGVYVYLWAGHPLAGREKITFDDLTDYPCLQFEQGEGSSFYYAEEIRSTAEYPRTIKANDRATMLNLMKGLDGYTLCSGIICEELNGGDYRAIPFDCGGDENENTMEIGYIARKNTVLSTLGEAYIQEFKTQL